MGDPYGCNCDIEFRKLERKHEEDLKAARAEGFEQGVKEMTSVMGSDQTDVAEAARKAYDRDLGAMKKVLEKEVEVKISKARDEVKWAELWNHVPVPPANKLDLVSTIVKDLYEKSKLCEIIESDLEELDSQYFDIFGVENA